MGTAYHFSGDRVRALEHWRIQERLLSGLLRSDPLNVERRSEWTALQRNLARLDVAANDPDRARTRLQDAITVLDEMLLVDPDNQAWTVSGSN